MKKIAVLIVCATLSLLAKETFYIQTIKIKPQTIQESRNYYGSLIEDDSLVRIITARSDGYVEQLLVKEKFDLIQNGEELFKMYSPELLQAQNEYINALRFKSNIAQTKEKLLLLDMNPKTIASISKTKKALNLIPFFSKYNGVVFEKNIIEGQYIKKGDPLYKIIDLSSLWLIVKIPQGDQEFIKKVKNASFKINGFKESFDAKFIKLLPQVNPNTKLIEARFHVANKDLKLFPNLFGVASLFQAQKTMLIAPKESVLLRNGNFYVFLKMEDESFEAVQIEGNPLENGDFEILSGIEEGSEIAKNALFILDADIQNNGGYE